MPIDDIRSARPSRPHPAPVEDTSDVEELDPCPLADCVHCGPDPTPDQLAAAERRDIDELHRVIDDIRAGREPLIAWDDVRDALLAPPTPQELAEARAQRKARARR